MRLEFFFHDFENFLLFEHPLYIVVIKSKIRKNKISARPSGHFLLPLGGQETILYLRLDNTGAWAIEVYPSLLCNRVSEQVDLYIKLKLVIFSFI